MTTKKLMKTIDAKTTSLSKAMTRLPESAEDGRRLLMTWANRGAAVVKRNPARAMMGAFLTGALLTAIARRA